MEKPDKTKEELMTELAALRQRLAEMENDQFKISTTEKLVQDPVGSAAWSPDELPCGYQSLDEEGRLLEVNKAWLAFTGYALEEVIGRWFGDFLTPASVELFREKFEEIKLSGHQGHVELDIMKKDGTTLPVACQGRVIRYSDGSFKQTRCIVQDISKERRLENTLSLAQTWYKLLIDNMDELVCVHDLQGTILFVNAAPSWTVSLPVDQLIGTNLRSYLAPQVLSEFDAYLHKIKSEGKASGTALIQRSDGQTRVLEYRNTLAAGPWGDPVIVGVARDVTEQRRTQRQLAETKQEWQETFDAIPDMIMILDREHNILKANKATEDRLGVGEGQLIGRKCFEAVHGADGPPDFCPHVEAMQNGREHWTDMSETLLGGEFHVSSTPWPTTKGQFEKAVHVARDVTEQKQLNAALEQQRNQFLSVLEHLGTPVSIVDPFTYEIMFVSREKGDLVEVDAVGKKCFEVFHGRSAPCPQCNNEHVLKLNGAVHRWEGYNQKLRRHFLYIDRIITWPDGRLVKLELSFDVTREKEAQARLLESEARYRDITEHSLTGIVIHQDGKAVYVNRRMTDMLGYTVEEMLGRQILDAVHPEDRAAILARFAVRDRGDSSTFTYETRLIKKSGESIWCELLTTVIQYGGRPAIMANILDISDRKRYMEELEAAKHSYMRLFEEARDQKELYLSLLNCSPDPIVVYDMEGKVR